MKRDILSGNVASVVLSLFDGISCGRVALDRANIDVTTYYASEIDKYAITITQANWPETIQIGDVTKWREWDIDWSSIDLLIGGSPCQGFSFAGKQAGTDAVLNGERISITSREEYLSAKDLGAEFLSQSHLFWEYVLCLDYFRSVNPNGKFLLENVKMKKELLDLVTKSVGVDPVFIDSQTVSAQKRQRWYWTNWYFEQPEEVDVELQSILETGLTDRKKAYALTARYYKAGNFDRYANKSSDQIIFELFGLSETCIAKFNRYNVKFIQHDTKIAKPLTAGDYGKLGKYGNYLRSLDCETQIRKLTPIECERLQTLPDNYTNYVSNTQRYKGIGNGWTIDVIVHIFMSMNTKNGKI